LSHVFPRHTRNLPPHVSHAEGAYLFDRSGKAYLDGSGGAAVSCLGHGDPHVAAAMKAQIDQVAFAHTGFFTSDPAEALADRLIALAPDRLNRVYFVSGGSEAMEAALKLARQYFLESGQPKRRHVIARKQSYHGNTLGALATGGNAWRREPFQPLLIDMSHVAPCYEYRDRGAHETTETYVDRLISELENEIDRLGPESVMAFVAEPVVGATLGAVPAVKGYFKRVREVCDRHGILLILDEVMCGMGRTGTLFASEAEDVEPDICAIAKGLGGGYQPIGAMLCSGAIYDAVAKGSGFFQHGHTYMAHPIACSAGLAVVERLVDDDVLSHVSPVGAELFEALQQRFGQNPYVGDIRGRGLFIGLELVKDREHKTPFGPEEAKHAKIKKAAFDAGLICYPMGGCIDGKRGDHVLLAPPFTLSSDQIGELVEKLGAAIDQVLD
jgi:adenosylmethionine-8-amino-7-oxononanoate aminotransferase